MIAFVGLMIVSFVASALWSGHPFHVLIRSPWVPLILAGTLLLGGLTHPPDRIIKSLASLLLVALGLVSLYQWWTGAGLFGTRAHAFMPHPNDLAIVPLLLPFAALWAWLFGAVAVVLSGSRNALLGVVVVAIACVPRERRRLVCLTVVFLALGWWLSRAPDFNDFGRAYNALAGRFGQWSVAREMFVSSPWLGTGPATFIDYYMPAAVAGRVSEIAYVPWAHSIYLEVLAERGLLGLVAVGIPLVWAWRVGSRSVRIALGAFLTMGALDLTFLKPWVLGMYWTLVGLASWTPQPHESRVRSAFAEALG